MLLYYLGKMPFHMKETVIIVEISEKFALFLKDKTGHQIYSFDKDTALLDPGPPSSLMSSS